MAPKPQKTLYLIRHGETEPNRQKIIQGSGLDAPLNETGHRQARDFFEAYRHIPFDLVVTSALIRTHQSVASFLQAGLPHRAMAGLNEISWGNRDGTRIDDQELTLYNRMLRDWTAGLLDRCFENGESPRQVALRMQKAADEIFSESGSTILMCIHGRAMRILLCILLGEPLTRMESFSHSNLCLYILDFDGDKWTIRVRNDVQHLR
jgi:broad specificity phosphatase PhoE